LLSGVDWVRQYSQSRIASQVSQFCSSFVINYYVGSIRVGKQPDSLKEYRNFTAFPAIR